MYNGREIRNKCIIEINTFAVSGQSIENTHYALNSDRSSNTYNMLRVVGLTKGKTVVTCMRLVRVSSGYNTDNTHHLDTAHHHDFGDGKYREESYML